MSRPQHTGPGTPIASPLAAVSESDYLTRGLVHVLLPAVSACDERIQAVYASQELLAAQIEQLQHELSAVKEQRTSVAPYIDKLTTSKLKLNSINSSLTRIVERLERIQLSLIPEEKKTRA